MAADADNFINELQHTIKRKAELYDGFNKDNDNTYDVNYILPQLVEELGEIASAIVRERYVLARDECIDLAHNTFRMYVALSNPLTKQKEK